jgi:hypothetical protein
VPVELAALVGKMMAKEPQRRFQEPKEVAQALRPFFKSGSEWSVGSKPEISQAGAPQAKPTTPGAVPMSTRPPTEMAAAPAPPARKPAEPTQPESAWESLIDFNEPEDTRPAAAPVAGTEPVGKQVRRFWPAIAGVAGLAAILLVAGVTYRISTDQGELVIETEDPDIEVIVKQGGKQVTIIDAQTKNRVELNSGNYELELFRRQAGPAALYREVHTEAGGQSGCHGLAPALVQQNRQREIGRGKRATDRQRHTPL